MGIRLQILKILKYFIFFSVRNSPFVSFKYLIVVNSNSLKIKRNDLSLSIQVKKNPWSTSVPLLRPQPRERSGATGELKQNSIFQLLNVITAGSSHL